MAANETEQRAGLPRGIGVKLRLARLAIAWERLWPAIWPATGVAGLFLALALLDALPRLAGWLHVAALGGFAGGFLYLAWRAGRRFAAPGHNDARRRLERQSGLEHRPLTVIEDTLAAGGEDAQSAALWRLHQRRMAELVRRLRVGMPAPGLARFDTISLRGALVLLLVIAGVVSWPEPGPRLTRALSPQFGGAAVAPAAAFDLWITPPAYTGMAPLFPLKLTRTEDGREVPETTLRVPVNSTLTAQVQGSGSVPRLMMNQDATNFTRVDPVHSRIEWRMTAGGKLSIMRGEEPLGSWTIDLIPDDAPLISFSEPPAPTPRGALRLVFEASDDYGVTSARAVFRRTYEKGEVIGKETLEIELALPGPNVKAAKETGFHDLTPHKWAGLAVVVELANKDAIDQTGRSERLNMVLPERIFVHPVARRIIRQRKRLTTEPEQRASIIAELEQIAAVPAAFAHDTAVFLALVAARARLVHEKQETAVDPVRELLWDTALGLEDGTLSVAERALRQAQRALMKALAENAGDAELERLMAKLQRALNRYLQALAQNMRNLPRDQQVMEFDPNMRLLEGSDLRRMLDQIRNLMRSGARQAAREMLARMQAMLENLRSAQMFRMRMPGMRGSGAMRELQGLIRRQQQLMDRTFRQTRPGFRQPRFGPQGAADQRALMRALEAMRGRLGRMPGAGRFLDQAGRAMGRAAGELDQNRPGYAVGPQGEALDRMQRAGRQMMQRMMDRFSRQNRRRGNRNAGQNRPRRDPMGREMGDDYDSSDVKIPDESAIQRAQRILDELRRRSGQLERPPVELDYINRLLQRF